MLVVLFLFLPCFIFLSASACLWSLSFLLQVFFTWWVIPACLLMYKREALRIWLTGLAKYWDSQWVTWQVYFIGEAPVVNVWRCYLLFCSWSTVNSPFFCIFCIILGASIPGIEENKGTGKSQPSVCRLCPNLPLFSVNTPPSWCLVSLNLESPWLSFSEKDALVC